MLLATRETSSEEKRTMRDEMKFLEDCCNEVQIVRGLVLSVREQLLRLGGCEQLRVNIDKLVSHCEGLSDFMVETIEACMRKYDPMAAEIGEQVLVMARKITADIADIQSRLDKIRG